MTVFSVGNTTVARIEETYLAVYDPKELFPEFSDELCCEHAHWLAPNHYDPNGASIDERSLAYYLGPCQVLRVNVARSTRIIPAMLPRELMMPRVLFATGTYPDPQNWNADFAALSVELIDLLHDRGVITVGIDTPSVDLFESKDLPAHKALLRHDMAILEGLVLNDAPEGAYELVALPLPLVGFDASPVRAVLIKK